MDIATLTTSRLSQALIGAIVACAWLYFAILHVLAYFHTGEASYLVFCLAESLAALLFCIRSQAVSVSGAAGDWLLAVATTFLPFLFAPSGTSLWAGAVAFIFAGALLQAGGLLSLNRSIGIVPAVRVIKTGGMYRIVRHPLYAAYLVTFSGYLLANWSVGNLLVYGAWLGLVVMRIAREEAHLRCEGAYRAYMSRVKFRVLPYIF